MSLKTPARWSRGLSLFGLLLPIACQSNPTESVPGHDPGFVLAASGTVADVSAGGHHSCGVKTDGTVACWGSNHDGALGLPTADEDAGTYARDEPAIVPKVRDVVEVADMFVTRGERLVRADGWPPHPERFVTSGIDLARLLFPLPDDAGEVHP